MQEGGQTTPLQLCLPQVLKKTFQAALGWLVSSPETTSCCDLNTPTQLFFEGDWAFQGPEGQGAG